MSALPPRRKDARPGRYQLGLFIRTPDGRVLELVDHDGSEERALEMLRAAGLIGIPVQPRTTIERDRKGG